MRVTFILGLDFHSKLSKSCLSMLGYLNLCETLKGLSGIWADLAVGNGLGHEHFRQMHLKICKNGCCSYDGGGLPDNDLPPGLEKLVEFRYEQSMEYCNQFYQDFHNVSDSTKIHNSYIANGAQG